MIEINADYFKPQDYFKKKEQFPSIPIFEADINFVSKITIAIPTYKRAEYLKEAIESALSQNNICEYDIVVLDNNPERNCDTEKMMLSYKNQRVSYYKNCENLGMYGNWNRCIELSSGRYLTILNDDDRLESNYLKSVQEILLKKPDFDALIVGYNTIDSEGKLISAQKQNNIKINKVIPLDLQLGNVNPGSLGILYSKDSLLKIGGYDEDFFPSSDYMFLVKYLVNFNQVFYLNSVLSNYRIAVNESKKITTLQAFIEYDKKIRQSFKFIYPSLSRIIALAQKVIELKQYKAFSLVSDEFLTIYSKQISKIEKDINILNKIAYKSIPVLCKLIRFKSKF